jgi:uncharacterized membrane protein
VDRLFGLPAHPLVVHIPVAMLPLAALGVVLMLIRRSWYDRYRWAVLAIATIGTIGAVIATSTGEGLQHQIAQREGEAAARAVHAHAESGDVARTAAIAFLVALAAWVIVPWYLERRAARRTPDATSDVAPVTSDTTRVTSRGSTWLRTALMVATAVTAVVSMVTIVDAGHSGASKAWEEYRDSSVGD